MNQLTINNRFNKMFGNLDLIKIDDNNVLFKANDVLRALGDK